jgi:PKD repeat protein
MKNIYLKQFFTFIIFFTFNQSFSQTTIILQPGPEDGKDSFIQSLTPLNINGNHQSMFAAAWTYSGYFGITRGLFEFDLSVIPDSVQVLDARLNLYYDPTCGHEGHYGENESYLQRITSSWEEYSVNWNNHPSVTYDNQVRIQTSINPTQNYPNINVTALIIDMINDLENSFGFMLKLQDESKYRSLIFASSDHIDESLRPKLEIIYLLCEFPIAEFSYSFSDKEVIFFDLSSSAQSWYWDFGDGFYSDLQNPTHIYNNYGTYYVCLTVEDSCGTDTYCDSVYLCQSPIADYDYFIIDKLVNFTNLSTDAFLFYWDFGDGYFSNLQNPIHSYSENGNYIACLTVENDCSTDIFCDTIKYYLGFDNFLILGNKFNVFPNPSKGEIYIDLKNLINKQVYICIFNSHGIIIHKQSNIINTNEKKLLINLSNMPKGIYFVKVVSDSFTETRKILLN